MATGPDIFAGVPSVTVPSADNAPGALKALLTSCADAALGVITENLVWVFLLFALAIALIVVYRLVFAQPYNSGWSAYEKASHDEAARDLGLL